MNDKQHHLRRGLLCFLILTSTVNSFLSNGLSPFHTRPRSFGVNRAFQLQAKAVAPSLSHSDGNLLLNDHDEDVTISTPLRGNHKVRAIMDTLKSHFDGDASSNLAGNGDVTNNGADKHAWSKARNYVYQAADSLTVEQVEEVITFLKSICDSHVSRKVIQTTPKILRRNVTTFLTPTAEFLVDLWGETLFQQAIERSPSVLLSSGMGYDDSTGHNTDQVQAFLKNRLGLSSKAINQLKRDAPFVFSLAVDKMEHVTQYLETILKESRAVKTNRIKDASTLVAKVITAHPNLLRLSVERNLHPRVTYLQNQCGLNQTELANLIAPSGAGILGLSVDGNLKPTIEYLLINILSGDRQILKRCILSHPALLGLSLDNFKAKVTYFDAIDAMDKNITTNKPKRLSLAARIAMRSPTVFSLSLSDNIVPTIQFLSRIWGVGEPYSAGNNLLERAQIQHEDTKAKTSANSLSALLQEYPTVLTLSLEGNIRPTVNFFNRTKYTVLSDDWNLIRGQGSVATIRGRYIAASLYNRLLPRWHYFFAQRQRQMELSRGPEIATDTSSPTNAAEITDAINENKTTDDATHTLPLHLTVSATDTTFCEHFGYDIKDFQAFTKEETPRLKFSSQFDTWIKTGRPIDV